MSTFYASYSRSKLWKLSGTRPRTFVKKFSENSFWSKSQTQSRSKTRWCELFACKHRRSTVGWKRRIDIKNSKLCFDSHQRIVDAWKLLFSNGFSKLNQSAAAIFCNQSLKAKVTFGQKEKFLSQLMTRILEENKFLSKTPQVRPCQTGVVLCILGAYT